jgi:Ca-activated chloride channel family protein
MTFAKPVVLVLLIAPVLLLIWTWRRQGRRVVLPFDHGVRRKSPILRALLDVAASLPALVLAVVILILAGPQKLSEPKTKRIMTNIEFCVDISGSMTAAMGEGTRYDSSMKAINAFLDFRKGDAFGLTFFGNNVLHWVPLTTDVSAFRCAPPFMRPEVAPIWFGGTAIGKALSACQKILTAREEGDRMIVLVSDGQSFDLENGNDAILAESLKKDNIVVYTIHVSDTEIPDPIVNIARLTGGEVFGVDDPGALEAVFAQIDKMQEAKIETTAAETLDNFPPYSIAGLSLLGTSLLCLFGLRYTPW